VNPAAYSHTLISTGNKIPTIMSTLTEARFADIIYTLTARFGSTGPWIETYTGRQFHFLAPDLYLNSTPSTDILLDIAKPLSRAIRFAGHCSADWWVACHLCMHHNHIRDNLEKYVPPNPEAGFGAGANGVHDLLLGSLLHDANEAFTTDTPYPLKCLEGELPAAIALHIQKAIYSHFDVYLSLEEEEVVKRADCACLKAEAYLLLPSRGEKWDYKYPNEPPANHFNTFPIKDYVPLVACQHYLDLLGRYVV